jgi:hypothetical protein
LRPGSTLSEVHQVATYASPDRSATIPPYGQYPGGLMESYFRLGAFFGYNDQNVVAAITVSRAYNQPPSGIINPATATLTFGGGVIECGDGYQSGSLRNVHRQILGEPDWASNFTTEIQTQYGPQDVQFYLDTYRILGMEVVGGDDEIFTYVIDRLVVVALYPLYYGKTAGGHGVGNSRAEWEQELGAQLREKTDPTYNATVHIYAAGARLFGIIYANNGASADDKAVMLLLNYQEN